MHSDPTEDVRRAIQADVNTFFRTREELEKEHGQVWSTDELTRDFNVMSFLAPFVIVRRKSDGKEGALMFQHSPRFYWGFSG